MIFLPMYIDLIMVGCIHLIKWRNPDTLDLLQQMLAKDPAVRISTYEALQHPAFRIVDAAEGKLNLGPQLQNAIKDYDDYEHNDLASPTRRTAKEKCGLIDVMIPDAISDFDSLGSPISIGKKSACMSPLKDSPKKKNMDPNKRLTLGEAPHKSINEAPNIKKHSQAAGLKNNMKPVNTNKTGTIPFQLRPMTSDDDDRLDFHASDTKTINYQIRICFCKGL